MKRIILTLFLLSQAQVAHVLAQDSLLTSEPTPGRYYELGWGSKPNTDAVSRNAITLTSLAFGGVNRLIDRSDFNNRLSRSANFVVVQFYLGSFAFSTIPHEFSGHYLRAREYGLKPGFHLNFPNFGGFVPLAVTYDEASAEARMMISAGGPEVSANTGYLATQEFYSGGRVPEYYGWYILNNKFFDGYLYTSSLDDFAKSPTQYFEDFQEELAEHPSRIDDPVGYVLALGESYGLYDSVIPRDRLWVYIPPDPDDYLNSFLIDQNDRIRQAYLLQLLDPSVLSSLYGIVRYLVRGELEYRPFMLRLGSTRFMPSTRANLGLLGVENYFDAFVAVSGLPPFNIYYRTGGNLIHGVQGGGLAMRSIEVTERLDLDIQGDYWRNQRTSRNNYNLDARGRYAIQGRCSIVGGAGYKTRGSLMGKPIRGGAYGSVAFGCRL